MPATFAHAQGAAEQEYKLGPLPTAGGHDDRSNGPSGPASIASASTNGGGVPGLLILLAVGAAACTGLAVWRMRTPTDSTDGTEDS
jgi:hypothetical protein